MFGAMASKPTEERRERVAAAQKAVKTNQLSLRVAGERYGLPKSTVHRHVSNEDIKVGAGRPTVLNEEELLCVLANCWLSLGLALTES